MLTRYIDYIRQDVDRAYAGRSQSTTIRLLILLVRHIGFRALLRYRMAAYAYEKGFRFLADALTARNTKLTGAEIMPGARIGPGCYLPHPVGVVIGNGCVVGAGVTVMGGVTIGERLGDHGQISPVIADGVMIGAGAAILGGITVGERAQVGANSVVLHDVDPHTSVVGSPAQTVKRKRGPSQAQADQPRKATT